jgi:hypothetical protein
MILKLQNEKSIKTCKFEIFIFIQQWLTQNMWNIETTICNF